MREEATVRVSMITPSSGRAALVLRKLDALAEQVGDLSQIEVVLIDNACPERVGTRAEARARERGWPFAVNVLRSQERLPAAKARTWGAREASGELLWWSDDDVIPRPNAYAAHLRLQAGRPRVTIGSVHYVHDLHPSDFRPRRAGPAQLTGANAMLPRDAYLAVAESLPDLPKPYGGEDALVGWALQQSGVRFSDAVDAWVDHEGPLPASLSGDCRKGREAGFNAVVISRHYPEAAWSLGVHPVEMLFKRVLFNPLWCAITSNSPRARFEHAFYLGAREAFRDRSGGSP